MGCDIHGTIEVKTANGWVCLSTPGGHRADYSGDYSHPVALSRNYARFAALAGVRGKGPEAKGLPEDVSETTKLLSDLWGADGHSHSYVSLEDAARIYLLTDPPEDPNGFAAKYPLSYFFNLESFTLDQFDDARFVFWFDN